MTDVQRDVREFLGQELGRAVSGVSNSDSLLEAGILDSMGVLALVGFLERTYAITVPDDELMPENLDTFDAIAALVWRRRQIDAQPS